MPTYLEVQQRVNLELLNRTDLIPEVKRAINQTIRKYETQRFWFNETATTVACSAGQSYVTVPADFYVMDSLRVTIDSADYILLHRAWLDLENFNTTRDRGFPLLYCQRGDRFELAPIPDSAYSMPIAYFQKLPPLSADSDTNGWLSAAEDMVAYGAARMVSMNIGRVDEAQIFGTIEREHYMSLCRMRDQRSFSSIRPTKF